MAFLRKHGALLTVGVLIALAFYGAGFRAGEKALSSVATGVENPDGGSEAQVDFAPFWKAWNIINEKYVPASTTKEAVDNQEKVWGAIAGLAASLNDPYTVFFPPVESEMFASDIRGNFEGVGMEVLAQDGAITVIAPLKNSPAFRAGILAGDRVIKIDGKETSGLTTEDAVQLIRGEKGTKVTLTIFRNGNKTPFDVSVIREVIDIPVINTKSLPGGVFVIELYSFSEQSPNLFRNALREFILSGDDKLLLDLRGNPGGYLEAAIDMASWFLPSSKVIVREDFGPGKTEKVYRSRGYDIFRDDLKFAILVDKGSASASEILAGALVEHGRAKLIGETTFGKGSVQELVDITSDTSLKVTVARWLTPNGLSISEKGIEPDFVVKYTVVDREAGKDPQMDKALEVLNQ
ncbi:MAG: Carboxyl-terminal protease [Parcubacteria group bacterium GW2011_GWA2_50_10b]|nr:MAG: Carboxyl-terminal protease [Parcubacteria group bacterium GW2011_GWA2_50_10b]